MKLPPNYIYIKMLDDEREILYQTWCKTNKLDPNLEYSVEEFFTAIDSASTQEYEQQD